ncbi:hypothetical protein PO124_06155 [Bacillus licheniformis]|nr:hypothetical protein [Bacillus licheniformis]
MKEFGAEELEELPLVLLLIVGIPGLMICLFFSFIGKETVTFSFDFYIVTIGGFFIKSLDTNFSAERISDNDRFLMTYHLLNDSRKPLLMVKRV